jgi:hypothetical protein
MYVANTVHFQERNEKERSLAGKAHATMNFGEE